MVATTVVLRVGGVGVGVGGIAGVLKTLGVVVVTSAAAMSVELTLALAASEVLDILEEGGITFTIWSICTVSMKAKTVTAIRNASYNEVEDI
jgi:hypothetical protein